MARLLLENGANVNSSGVDNQTPLFAAAGYGKTPFLHSLYKLIKTFSETFPKLFHSVGILGRST